MSSVWSQEYPSFSRERRLEVDAATVRSASATCARFSVHAKPSTLVVLAAARPPKLSMLDMDRDIDGTCHRWTLHRQSSQWVGPAEAGCKPPKDLDPGNEARVSRAVYARNLGSNAYTRPSASDSAAVPQAA
eukprot:CAMPEP_0181215576 /NCGR_PEP_ID=MMETSP1096-20121128/26089_1 /TAXON_ID=156174 ORGANISM="Chrysochromulina ericina, Strain CCMP281" /NCGR_SAMPLE_ID=MMETSP1096 /ASSEMBLY_ACC=CAM_ASM_000453 /LENGTH=131 /DNA_ID=CAMNT_0023307445 /DNA_START=632 /DNA_END=1027 /DNA_ORIENTATION=+